MHHYLNDHHQNYINTYRQILLFKLRNESSCIERLLEQLPQKR